MPTVVSGSARLYYEVTGSGPALLFAHGAGGNAASWWQQVPHFRDRYRVVTFDHRGFGRSSCAPDDFSPARFDADALAILDDAQIDRAHVVCQSMGGWTGVRLAVAVPTRVASLTLANTPGAIYSDALREQMRRLTATPPTGDLTAMTLGTPYKTSNPAGAYLYQAITAFNTTRMPIDRLMTREAFVDPARLSPFPVPVQMIASDLDVTFPLALLRATAARIGAPLVVIEGAGHSTYFEKPAEFNDAVASFLANHG
jgi:3-oxoadipate enol-lactonase